jgi:hypothetical protein
MANTRKASKKSRTRKPAKKAESKKKPSKSKTSKSKARKALAKAKAGKAPAKPKARKGLATAKAKKTSAKTKAAKKTSPELTSPEPTKAMRLTFAYEGDDVKLVSQKRTEMKVPPSDPVTAYSKQKGFWAELKNERDKTLYRHVMHNPTRNDAEIFPETPGQSISREPAPKRKGLFVVVVPDTNKGEEVTLFRSSPDEQGPASGLRALAREPATEIMRFKLKK